MPTKKDLLEENRRLKTENEELRRALEEIRKELNEFMEESRRLMTTVEQYVQRVIEMDVIDNLKEQRTSLLS